MTTTTSDRAHQILHLLLQKGKSSVDDLAAIVGTSSASVRRDLTKLEQRGLVNRSHGSVELAGKMTYEAFRFDAAFPLREERFADEKRRIAIAAAEMVQEGETIGISPGTTTTQMARCLRHRNGIRIVTSAVNIGLELSSQPSLQVTLTGGSIRWPGSFSMVGATAFDSLQRIFFDKVYIGVCGVHPEFGVTVIEPDEAMIVRAMVDHARQVIVVADSSKMDIVSAAGVCPTGKVHTIVTDNGIAPEVARNFENAGVTVVVV
jgi:DeoR family transcriptional regulator, aga operon transcriptional repressor